MRKHKPEEPYENRLPGGNPEWEPFSHFFNREEIPAKTLLLREGEIARKAFYIEKGCLRVWFNREGREITFQFFFEGQGVSSVESFRTNTPSLFNIETIEPSVIHVIAKNDFEHILSHSEAIRRTIEQHTLERLIYYQRLFLSHIKNSPQERYEALLKDHPAILHRVPQHYIASYLGITPVHLSRIRNSLLKRK
ncbi:Crp/Fnr family transcriptional regulator [Compostibacter hankyongensis]|uniref:Crp/Fnr family transcriptional regulator n=1 Tax=Compostibacter hankyongensis TaxID=1007089 RepID=A0ABP8G6F5_9BACT